jgi:DNA-binding PucR family transcriptional regulator
MPEGQHLPRDEVSRSIERFLAALREHAAQTGLAQRVAVEASHAQPEAAPDPVLRADLEAAAIESLRAFLSATAHELEPVSAVPAAAIEFARTLAQRRLGIAVLLNTYRAGQSSFWRDVMATATLRIPDADVRAEALMRLWDLLSRWLDSQLSQLSEIYEAERDRFIRGAMARRIEIVNSILSEDSIDTDRAERILGHDLHRRQTGLVLWTADAESSGDDLSSLERLALDLAASVGASRPLLVPSGAGSLWAWLATGDVLEAGAFASAQGLQNGRLRVALGRTAPGVLGFRQSHWEALAAQRIALAVKPSAPLTSYADAELLALVSQDPVAARALVAHELASLTGADRTRRILRETALAYLQNGGNAAAAARTLRIHKNTVHYRLHHTEELLGRPLEPGNIKLQLALELVQAFGHDLAALGGYAAPVSPTSTHQRMEDA